MERHYRASSPGARRLAVSERSSTGTVNSYEPSYYSRTAPRDVYNPPRGASTDSGVIPISTTTYVSNRPPTITRNGSNTGYDPYTGRPRRSTLTEADALRGGSVQRSGSSRTQPTVIQTSGYEQPKSPRTAGERDYLMTPSTSGPSRGHKKVYSVDDGKSRLVDDNHNRTRRESLDRSQYRTYAAGGRSTAYHLSGPVRSQPSVDDQAGYSYTDPASMYRDTEPRWRPRRGSIESSRRDRPTSMLESYPAKPAVDRQLGPPPSTRGFDKITDGLQRPPSVQNAVRAPATYDLQPYDPLTNSNGYSVPARPASARPPTTVHQDNPQRYAPYADDYEREREPRRPNRKFEDSSVESRGFGIRSGSIDRYASRDASLDRRATYQADPLISEPDLRRYIPEPVEPPRREPDRLEREYPKEFPKERERPRERERERERDWEREPVRDRDRDREKERDRERERERDRERDREREREREREKEREREREREVEKERRRERERDDDSERRHRDRERHRERERDDKERDEGKSRLPGMGAAAAAVGAAALGGEMLRERKREKERDHEEDDERTRRHRKPDSKEELDKDRRYPDEEPRELREPREAREARERYERKPSPRESASEISDPDADYRRRVAQVQQDLHRSQKDKPDESSQSDEDHERKERRRERRERREQEAREREERDRGAERGRARDADIHAPPPHDDRRQSVFDAPLVSEPDPVNDGSSKESRVRIVEPPKDDKDEAPAPRSILRKPTEKFPEDPNPIREGVAPLKDATKKGIPPGARWTKIDRRLVNPEALEDAKERFEERLDCVIVLRVLTREEIQKFADRTKEIRGRTRRSSSDADRHFNSHPPMHPAIASSSKPRSLSDPLPHHHTALSSSRILSPSNYPPPWLSSSTATIPSPPPPTSSPSPHSSSNSSSQSALYHLFCHIVNHALIPALLSSTDERYDRERSERKERKQKRHEERARDPEGYASRHPQDSSRKHHRHHHSHTESGDTDDYATSRNDRLRHGRDRDTDGAVESSEDSEEGDYSESEAEYEDAHDQPRAIEPPPQMLPPQIHQQQHQPQLQPVGVSFAPDERGGPPAPMPWANGHGAAKEDARR